MKRIALLIALTMAVITGIPAVSGFVGASPAIASSCDGPNCKQQASLTVFLVNKPSDEGTLQVIEVGDVRSS